MERISDEELGEICERNGFPSVAQRLHEGETQEQATLYMLGRHAEEMWRDDDGVWIKYGPQTYGPFASEDDADNFANEKLGGYYDDGEGRWLKEYVETLHHG